MVRILGFVKAEWTGGKVKVANVLIHSVKRQDKVPIEGPSPSLPHRLIFDDVRIRKMPAMEFRF